ncbi:hypothetical protein [Micromonospora sp. Llam0]|uniref:hypothetical protein n=1 Tax=Micromonospora sp. Llam0 TaxID=2485143 RepID=UPI000F48AC4F|nr:hypothetical protein [Micromonospora sp. Llam0]
MRTRISRQFLELDGALRDVVDGMHRDIAEVLTVAGRLDLFDAARGLDFLVLLVERLPQGSSASEVRYALAFLIDFRLNYRGLIQHRVRRVLDKLAPDTISFPADTGPTEIRYILEELLSETLFDIETELSGTLYEPHEAVFAVAEEFRDRVLRSQGAQDEWRTIYEALRDDVWSDEFAALTEKTETFNRWIRAVEKIAAVARTDAGAGQETVI